MKKKIESGEVNILDVIINIYDNKLKIAAITLIFIVISTILYTTNKPLINAKTEILPITIFENNLYSQFNALTKPQGKENEINILPINRFDEINRGYLLSLFIEELQTKEIIIEGIKKYQLLDRKKYDSEKKYLEAIKKKALKLNLLKPFNVDGSKRGASRLNWIIEFEINDEKKWEEVLGFIENKLNNNIKKYLRFNFESNLNNLLLLEQFELEDLNLKIKNVKKDYETETTNRLAFLKEQLLIAKKLNIENNTLEVENFITPSKVISNLQTAKQYYMRGYLMIEEEIELIENRTNKDAFTKNLVKLEKKRRTLLENKSLERLKSLFDTTPIITGNDFKAANIIYLNTNYKITLSLIKVILSAGILGIIFGSFYVLISNSIQQRK